MTSPLKAVTHLAMAVAILAGACSESGSSASQTVVDQVCTAAADSFVHFGGIGRDPGQRTQAEMIINQAVSVAGGTDLGDRIAAVQTAMRSVELADSVDTETALAVLEYREAASRTASYCISNTSPDVAATLAVKFVQIGN